MLKAARVLFCNNEIMSWCLEVPVGVLNTGSWLNFFNFAFIFLKLELCSVLYFFILVYLKYLGDNNAPLIFYATSAEWIGVAKRGGNSQLKMININETIRMESKCF